MKETFQRPTDKPIGAHTEASIKKTQDYVEEKLLEKLIRLPLLPKALGNYVPVVQSGKQIFVSGQLPIKDGSLGSYKGRLGREVSVDAGKRAAQLCTLNALAHLKRELGSLEKIKQVLKITGFVANMPNFVEQPTVLNGASDLLVELFGEKGRHARSAVGVTDLPLGACVEIEYLFEIK